MKIRLSTMLLFAFLLVAADELRLVLERAVFATSVPPLGDAMLVALAYSVPFGLAGALLAWQLKSTWAGGVAVALVFGLCSIVAVRIVANDLRPAITYSHAAWWAHVLGWGNLYMPVVASMVGAAAFHAFAKTVATLYYDGKSFQCLKER